MPVLGDVYQLTTSARYLEQLVQNVFFYRVEDTPTPTAVEGLISEFIDEVIPPLIALQNSTLNYFNVAAVNLFDKSDILEVATDIDGGVACSSPDTVSPSFVAAHFKLVRDNARVRNGSKYVAALCEGYLQGNSIVGQDAQLEDIADAFAATLTAGGVDSFRPVIVARVRTTASRINRFGQTVSYYKYALPESQSQMGNKWAYVREAQGSTDVSHMDSRQKGRGA